MKVLIFEDEIPAYDKLIGFIEKYLPDAELKGWGRSINEAKRLLNKYDDVELIFSDIELLDGSSLNIYKDVSVNCPIIFCTAFDQYILEAFQTNGIAYLLKPYDEATFKEAIGKYKTLFSGKGYGSIPPGVIKELTEIKETKKFKQRFTVKKKGGIKLVSAANIVAFLANGDFSFALDDQGQKNIINYSIGEIESKVDPDKFFRISRSEMINIEYIDKIEPYFKNRLSIKMNGLKDSIHTSTSRTPDFRTWIDR